MGITVRHNRLAGNRRTADDPLQNIAQTVIVGNISLHHFRAVVSGRLDFNIVIPAHCVDQTFIIAVAGKLKDLVVQAGTSDQDIFPFLVDAAAADPRFCRSAAFLAHNDERLRTGFRHQFIETPQTVLILRENDHMRATDLLVGIFILHIIEFPQCGDTALIRITHQGQEYRGKHLRIVIGTVRNIFVIGNPVKVRHIAKTVKMSFLQNRAGKIQRIDDRIVNRLSAKTPQFFIQEVVVKRCIMRDEHRISDPLKDLIDGFRKRFGTRNHVIGNICFSGNDGRNRHRRLDKPLHPVGYRTVFDLYRTEFNDGIIETGKTCGFKVETDKRAVIEFFIGRIADDCQAVFRQVHLASKSDLERMVRILFCKILGRIERFYKALYIRMVGNADAFMAKSEGIFDHRSRRTDAVHFRHVCMHMKLNALFFRSVLHRFDLFFIDLNRNSYQIFCKVVRRNGHIKHVMLSDLDRIQFFNRKITAFKALYKDRIRTVIHRKRTDLLADSCNDIFRRKYFTADPDVIRLIQHIAEIDERPVLPLRRNITFLFHFRCRRRFRFFPAHNRINLIGFNFMQFEAKMHRRNTDPVEVILDIQRKCGGAFLLLFVRKHERKRLIRFRITETSGTQRRQFRIFIQQEIHVSLQFSE